MDNETNPDLVQETNSQYGEQDYWGNSIAMLRHNLKLSPTDRVRQAQLALETALELKNAGQIHRLQKGN